MNQCLTGVARHTNDIQTKQKQEIIYRDRTIYSPVYNIIFKVYITKIQKMDIKRGHDIVFVTSQLWILYVFLYHSS